MSEETEILPPYEVPGIGTVTGHEGDSYIVRHLDGRVLGHPAAPDTLPSSEAAAADIAASLASPQLPPPPPARWRVLKDTIWMRLKDAEKQVAATAAINSVNAAQRMDWDCQSWFWSDGPMREFVQGVGADPDVILAPDPLAP